MTPAIPDPPLDLLTEGLEPSPLPTAVVSGSLHIIRYANPAFCRLLYLPIQQLIGHSLTEFVPNEDDCVRLLDRVFRSGQPETHTQRLEPNPNAVLWSYTMWAIGKGRPAASIVFQIAETTRFHGKTSAMNEALVLGSLRQHELREISDSENVHLLAEIEDRKRTEAALIVTQDALREAHALLADKSVLLDALVRERTAKLQETVEELEAFSYSIAHDLRAPLRSMQAFAEILLKEHAPELNADGRHFLLRIAKSAVRMDHLTRDVLNYSQVLRKNFELDPVDMQKLVLEVLDTYPLFASENAHFVLEGVLPTVMGNEAMLTQVFSNLMSNAVKFVRAGETPRIRVWSESANGMVRIFVQDFGIGIPPDQHARVFGVFEQLDKTYDGTGIGLAIVKKAIERMGGSVGLEPGPVRGTTVWFELKSA